jgi:hypothetical protein
MELSWSDELMRWYNKHPEFVPFTEDKDSQRIVNGQDDY